MKKELGGKEETRRGTIYPLHIHRLYIYILDLRALELVRRASKRTSQFSNSRWRPIAANVGLRACLVPSLRASWQDCLKIEHPSRSTSRPAGRGTSSVVFNFYSRIKGRMVKMNERYFFMFQCIKDTFIGCIPIVHLVGWLGSWDLGIFE